MTVFSDFRHIIQGQGEDMAYPQENRVRCSILGRITSPYDPHLISVPSIPGKHCILHWLAAKSLDLMIEGCARDTGIKLAAASGWRPRRWPSRQKYEEFLLLNYAYLVKNRTFATAAARRAAIIEAGDDYIAFDTPHQTGLCIDFGTGGLSPNTKTIDCQRQTSAYAWLCEHAHEYGWTPYNKEPWHWEFNIAKSLWESLP